jgi:catechol 2,3-dioxygenase-like lactoylglutathione lyase family enzyme
MITGAHILLYSQDPDADRAFLRDVLGFPFVDVGHGWLIFALPAAEAAVHPAGGDAAPAPAGHLGAVLYLMCDDLAEQIRTLETKGVRCAEVTEERWGMRTAIRLPSGGEVGLYQPSHPTALGLVR